MYTYKHTHCIYVHRIDGLDICVAYWQRLIDTLAQEEPEVRRRLADVARKMTVLRVNEKALTRRFRILEDINMTLRKVWFACCEAVLLSLVNCLDDSICPLTVFISSTYVWKFVNRLLQYKLSRGALSMTAPRGKTAFKKRAEEGETRSKSWSMKKGRLFQEEEPTRAKAGCHVSSFSTVLS